MSRSSAQARRRERQLRVRRPGAVGERNGAEEHGDQGGGAPPSNSWLYEPMAPQDGEGPARTIWRGTHQEVSPSARSRAGYRL